MTESGLELAELMRSFGRSARAASRELANTDGQIRAMSLRSAAASIRSNETVLLSANADDVSDARQSGINTAMLDRLTLNSERIEAMATGLESIAELADPVGRLLAEWDRPNGLKIQRVAVPLGVIGMIYESRPNVTADAAGLCIKSGNAVILRGGSFSLRSNRAIYECMRAGLIAAELSVDSIQLIPTRDRDAVGFMLASMSEWIDVIVPRGGKSLVERVQKDARIPVIGHLEGICHVYLHEDADTEMAREVVLNAKMRRTGICGAAETVLVDRSAAGRLLPGTCEALLEAGCEIRGDKDVQQIVRESRIATEADWTTEYLDAVVSIRVVDNIDDAIDHIAKYGSGHTESIISNDEAAARHFLYSVDSAIVLHNASTQFADGAEFGMGAEIGIATGRLHARGPVGTEQLTSYKYIVRGNGQVRP